jgi:hypothetical protein
MFIGIALKMKCLKRRGRKHLGPKNSIEQEFPDNGYTT